jgi:hypothetical protein
MTEEEASMQQEEMFDTLGNFMNLLMDAINENDLVDGDEEG